MKCGVLVVRPVHPAQQRHLALRRGEERDDPRDVRGKVPGDGGTIVSATLFIYIVGWCAPGSLRFVRDVAREHDGRDEQRAGNDTELRAPRAGELPAVEAQQQERGGEERHDREPYERKHLGDDDKAGASGAVQQPAEGRKREHRDIRRARARDDGEEEPRDDAVQRELLEELACTEDACEHAAAEDDDGVDDDPCTQPASP